MRAEDPNVQELLQRHLVNARRAVAADRAVMIVEANDENREMPTTMVVVDMPDVTRTSEVVSWGSLMLGQALQNILQDTPLRLVLIDPDGSYEIDFMRADFKTMSIDIPDGDD